MIRFLRIAALAFAFNSLIISASLWGQSASTAAQDSLENQRIAKTTRIAALIPGGGQITNRKYWKVPLVWGGVAWCISSIDYNLKQLNEARTDLIELEESDPTTIGYAQALSIARTEEAFYRRNRDLSWFALIGVHALSVLDAHVDANLMSFDVSENLAVAFRPIPIANSPAVVGPGLVIRWHRLGRNLTNYDSSQWAKLTFKRKLKWT